MSSKFRGDPPKVSREQSNPKLSALQQQSADLRQKLSQSDAEQKPKLEEQLGNINKQIQQIRETDKPQENTLSATVSASDPQDTNKNEALNYEERSLKEGKRYDERTGTYQSEDAIIKTDKALEAKQRDPASDDYIAWRKDVLGDDITKDQWYNNEQVSALTKQEVPVGGQELKEFLQKNQGKDVSFSYLKTPNEQDDSLNHFVSVSIKGNKVTYLDSNGEVMDNKDRDIISQTIKGAEIAYRDQDGKEISEQQAKDDPSQILRTQFENGSCGTHACEATNAMKNANGDEEKIQTSLRDLKNLDVAKARQQHGEQLQQQIRMLDAKQSIKQDKLNIDQVTPESLTQKAAFRKSEARTFTR